MADAHLLPDRILFGAAFYNEYRVNGDLEGDLDLMAEASFSVIRVGESVWATWEPEPGVYHLDWLQPVLDGAHARGISVVLGTPTYAVPPWLRAMDPELAGEEATGVRHPWGRRQEVDITHPLFRQHAEGVIRAIAAKYASHPAIIGYQVDNEPGPFLLHNQRVFDGFLGWLEGRYEDVETLNREWGLTFWSQRIRSWDELWRPDGNHSPQYQLEWRRYQAELVTEFIAWQARIVREYAGPRQFVTTCISYERPAIDDRQLVQQLDVTAGNPYYMMQDALRIGVEVPRTAKWWSSGVWALFEQGDRMFSSAQAPFLVTETNAQSIGQSHWQHHTPYPGQIALAGLALVARGARMIEYWQWQTPHYGIETYWGGVLPHSGQPGRIYREIAELGRRLRDLGPVLEGFTPDADVALLYSIDTKHSFEFYPPLADAEGGPDGMSYLRIFDRYYRAAFEAGTQSRIVHAAQFRERDTEDFVAEFPTLVVPTLYVADDGMLDALVRYAEAGGHLVVGIRTGYGDQLARARPERAPGRLAAAAGVWYDEYSSLDAPVGIDGATFGGGHAEGWADALVADGADVVAVYSSGIYAGRPAVTSREHGAGRVTYVGMLPDLALATSILRWAVPIASASEWQFDAPVTVTSGSSGDERVWFISNWSSEPATAHPPQRSGGKPIVLEPWDVTVLVEQRDPESGAVYIPEPERVEPS
ncbi:beta-galactosidase [Pengzhenrongella sicca]|nr:beta-galactosidase [Pengzhenrongella sicca]